ncbi:MAG: SOS response-associated peptidase, partial [Anaerolineae bacterium]
MCGRFTLTLTPEALQRAFPWLTFPPGIQQMQPRYNIAPSQPVAVVPNDGQNRLDFFIWGLVPFWSKDPKRAFINARAETVAEKPAFKAAFRYRRCLILADGFYEWKPLAGRRKQPYYIHHKDGSPFAFAGIWERWSSPDGSELLTCAIITTAPNDLMAA